MRLTQRTSEDREILCERVNDTTVDGAVTRYNAVSGILFVRHTEFGASMGLQCINFDKVIKEELESLVSRKRTFGVLFRYTSWSTAFLGTLIFEAFSKLTLDVGRIMGEVKVGCCSGGAKEMGSARVGADGRLRRSIQEPNRSEEG